MTGVLEEMAAAARRRVEARKAERPLTHMVQLAERTAGIVGATGAYRTFQEAITAPGLSVIAELKPTPESFPYLDIAYAYEAGDADAVSCYIEPDRFLGSEEMFLEVRDEVSAPLLCRDFVVDPYQLYEAKYLGADAVVLMCALLTDDELATCLQICDKLHLDALVEAHDADEVRRAVASRALLIGVCGHGIDGFDADGAGATGVNTGATGVTGVNDVSTADTNSAGAADADDRGMASATGATGAASADISAIVALRELVPSDCHFVVESGIRSIEDARAVREAGADAVLVGELLLRATDDEQRQTLLRTMKDIK